MSGGNGRNRMVLQVAEEIVDGLHRVPWIGKTADC